MGGEQDTDGRRLSGPTSHLQGTLFPREKTVEIFFPSLCSVWNRKAQLSSDKVPKSERKMKSGETQERMEEGSTGSYEIRFADHRLPLLPGSEL